jgi:hypothetical protein
MTLTLSEHDLELERLEDDGAPEQHLRDVRWSAGDLASDGSWWPRSRDAVVELRALLPLVLEHSGIDINRVSLHIGDWSGALPRRMTYGDRVVRLGWFRTLAAHTATLGRGSDPRLVLHVHPCTEVTS